MNENMVTASITWLFAVSVPFCKEHHQRATWLV